MKRLTRFIKPDRRKLLLLAVFVMIMAGGWIQAWAFSEVGTPPPLYDVLRPIPFWSLWVYLMIPLAWITSPLRLLGFDLLAGPAWVFNFANLAYFYVLSCGVIEILGVLRERVR